MIPVFMTFRGESWTLSGQWHWFWSWSPLFSKLLCISYLTQGSCREAL